MKAPPAFKCGSCRALFFIILPTVPLHSAPLCPICGGKDVVRQGPRVSTTSCPCPNCSRDLPCTAPCRAFFAWSEEAYGQTD